MQTFDPRPFGIWHRRREARHLMLRVNSGVGTSSSCDANLMTEHSCQRSLKVILNSSALRLRLPTEKRRPYVLQVQTILLTLRLPVVAHLTVSNVKAKPITLRPKLKVLPAGCPTVRIHSMKGDR